jgi:acetyl-CoA acetyltransferase
VSDAHRGAVSIVGVGTTAQGELPGKSADEIAVDAFRLALDDAGIGKSEIDGLITCRSFGGFGIDIDVGALAGLNPRFSATLDYGTCNFSLHLAVMAVVTGLATTVALMYGTNQRSAGNRFSEPAGDEDFLAPYGFFNIAGPAALAFQRHQHLYGTTERQLGEIAVTAREHARLNPAAIFRKPLTIEDYLASRYIVRPLRRPDLCMISDGGACLIVTATERAAAHPRPPVRVMGMAQTSALRGYQNDDQLLRPWIADVASRIYANAGVAQSEVDVLYVQDPTSVWILQMLEWYGFCPIGEGGAFVQDGRIRLGGKLPVNTNGGQLSESYMWGWLHLAEAVRQLRGECGERQVPGAAVAQYCSTMAFSKAASTILASEAA